MASTAMIFVSPASEAVVASLVICNLDKTLVQGLRQPPRPHPGASRPLALAEDQLIRDLGEGAAALAPALTDLELDGRIARQPGGLLALAA